MLVAVVAVRVLLLSSMCEVETVESTRALKIGLVATDVESATSLHASTATAGGEDEKVVREW